MAALVTFIGGPVVAWGALAAVLAASRRFWTGLDGFQLGVFWGVVLGLASPTLWTVLSRGRQWFAERQTAAPNSREFLQTLFPLLSDAVTYATAMTGDLWDAARLHHKATALTMVHLLKDYPNAAARQALETLGARLSDYSHRPLRQREFDELVSLTAEALQRYKDLCHWHSRCAKDLTPNPSERVVSDRANWQGRHKLLIDRLRSIRGSGDLSRIARAATELPDAVAAP